MKDSLKKDFEELSQITSEIQSSRLSGRSIFLSNKDEGDDKRRAPQIPPKSENIHTPQLNFNSQTKTDLTDNAQSSAINDRLKDYVIADGYYEAVDEEKRLNRMKEQTLKGEQQKQKNKTPQKTMGGVDYIERGIVQGILSASESNSKEK